MSAEGAAAGQLLRKRIWEPLEPSLGGAKTVLISPDGVLGRLPIAALPGKKAGSYLLEEYRLTMLPVPQLLPAMVSELGRKELKGRLLLMGDVDYNTKPGESKNPQKTQHRGCNTSLVRGGTTFSELAATAGEIASIKKLYTDLFKPSADDISILEQADATEEVFRNLSPGFNTLHLATHGFFLPDTTDGEARPAHIWANEQHRRQTHIVNPMHRSGLALAGANKTLNGAQSDLGEDGILTAEEVSGLDLWGTELVVLSACETGLGSISGGEGVMGLGRAFVQAGAENLVMSLWSVPDEATQEIMKAFYYRHLKGQSVAAALGGAQRAYLKKEQKAGRDGNAFFWAAFVANTKAKQ